jgi:hypothetical protein
MIAFFGETSTVTSEDVSTYQLIEHMDLGGRAGPGVLFHWAATTPEGVHAVDVYKSLEAADQLVETKVGPAAERWAWVHPRSSSTTYAITSRPDLGARASWPPRARRPRRRVPLPDLPTTRRGCLATYRSR